MQTKLGHSEVKMGSERGFGLVFAAVFAIVAFWPLVSGLPVRYWALAVAAVFMGTALAAPRILAPFNRLWFKLGLLLGAVVAPIMMSLLYFLAVTPTAIIMRALGKDPLRTKIDRSAESYWMDREEPVGSMKNQF